MKLPFIRALVLGALAIALETAAFYALWVGGGANANGMIYGMSFFALHAGASLVLAMAMPAIALFAFVFSLTLPILGMLGIVLAVGSGIGRFKAPVPSTWVPLYVEKATYHAAPESRYFGAGGFRSRLLQRHLPATRRLPHLMTLGRRSTPFANRLLKDMLRDPSDEMRLAAYAILERRERESQTHLAGATERRLMQGHWEIAYQGLAEGEEVGRHLRQALSATETALKASPRATDLWLLKGRILARLGDGSEALRAYTMADEVGASPLRSLPYQAEIAFQNRDFDGVRKHMRALHAHIKPKRASRGHGLGAQGLNPAMNKVLNFWTSPSTQESA
jgi:polysaccharide biosynthesis protein PelE